MKKKPAALFKPVRSESEHPHFGPGDSEGFRTFSLTDEDGQEIVRLSFHIDRFSATLPRFTDDETKGLMLAATMAAARDGAKTEDPAILSAWLRAMLPRFIAEQIEQKFPILAMESLRISAAACVKFALSGLAQSQGAPKMYGKEAAAELMTPLYKAITVDLMRIAPGARPKLLKQLEDTKAALVRLDDKHNKPGHNWTPRQVAHAFKPEDPNNPEIEPSTISKWLTDNQLTWQEWSKTARLLP